MSRRFEEVATSQLCASSENRNPARTAAGRGLAFPEQDSAAAVGLISAEPRAAKAAAEMRLPQGNANLAVLPPKATGFKSASVWNAVIARRPMT
jgi:hypothetical protein